MSRRETSLSDSNPAPAQGRDLQLVPELETEVQG